MTMRKRKIRRCTKIDSYTFSYLTIRRRAKQYIQSEIYASIRNYVNIISFLNIIILLYKKQPTTSGNKLNFNEIFSFFSNIKLFKMSKKTNYLSNELISFKNYFDPYSFTFMTLTNIFIPHRLLLYIHFLFIMWKKLLIIIFMNINFRRHLVFFLHIIYLFNKIIYE